MLHVCYCRTLLMRERLVESDAARQVAGRRLHESHILTVLGYNLNTRRYEAALRRTLPH